MISINRIQILGIEDLQGHSYNERKQELIEVVKKHDPICIQLGSIDILSLVPSKSLKTPEKIHEIKNLHEKEKNIMKNEGFSLAIKENLPPSTYIIDLHESLLVREKYIATQHKTRIKKARNNGVNISEATNNEYDSFYALLQVTGKNKGFGIIGYTTFHNLIEYLYKYDTGKLFVAKIGENVIAGAVYIIDKTNSIGLYLYGGTDRSYSNVGASHLLHREISNILQKDGIQTIDLLGGGPTGYPNHHLASVGLFKEGFGGNKIDYLGSYDIVYKPTLYKIWKFLRNIHI